MKPRRLVMVVSGVVLATAAALVSMAGDDAEASRAELEGQLKELLQLRLESADLAFKAMTAAFEAETVTLSDLADARSKLAEAEVAVAAKPEDEIAALRRYVARAQQTEHKVKLLYQVGTRGGEAKEYSSAMRDRQSAEILLLKARIKYNK